MAEDWSINLQIGLLSCGAWSQVWSLDRSAVLATAKSEASRSEVYMKVKALMQASTKTEAPRAKAWTKSKSEGRSILRAWQQSQTPKCRCREGQRSLEFHLQCISLLRFFENWVVVWLRASLCLLWRACLSEGKWDQTRSINRSLYT